MFVAVVIGWQPFLDRHLEWPPHLSCDHRTSWSGGGNDIADWCMARQVVHIGEYMNRGRKE